MTLGKRLAYYAGGFIIGLIILSFFLGEKKASCDYGPNARTLKNIRSKELTYSIETLNYMEAERIDSAVVEEILMNGDVRFSESNTALDSCKIYIIDDGKSKAQLKLKIENCDKVATILDISPIN